MPIYEYACNDCGHELEVLQKMNDLPLTQCPACNNPSLKKKISAAGFRLKGTGWYETDFKNKNNKPGAVNGKTEKGDKTEKTEDKTEKTDKSNTNETKTDTKTSTGEKSTASASA
jgi:putative FmdB family regulatory protein